MVYQRNGRVEEKGDAVRKPMNQDSITDEQRAPGGVKINGFEQVLELLRAADYEFRVSLLKRLHGKNPKLGVMLYQELVLTGHIKSN